MYAEFEYSAVDTHLGQDSTMDLSRMLDNSVAAAEISIEGLSETEILSLCFV